MITPIMASQIIPLALPIELVFPALVIYMIPPMVIMRRAVIPIVQMPNLYMVTIYVARSGLSLSNPGMFSMGVYEVEAEARRGRSARDNRATPFLNLVVIFLKSW